MFSDPKLWTGISVFLLCPWPSLTFAVLAILLLVLQIVFFGKVIFEDFTWWLDNIHAWRVLSWLILVISVVLISYNYERIKSKFPWLITWQLQGYRLFSLGERPASRHVVPVEIDDATFYGYMGNKGEFDDMTKRDALAQLVRIAKEQQAAVIALDINLNKTHTESDHPCKILKPEKELSEEDKDNRKLDCAIRDAVNARIPVVLPFGFQGNGQPVPSVFFDAKNWAFPGESAPTLRVGFDHAPDDMRKVPLEVSNKIPGLGSKPPEAEYRFPSFALQIVDAFESAKPGKYLTRERLRDQRDRLEFVYTTYLKRRPLASFSTDSSEFQCVSAGKLLCANPQDQNASCSAQDRNACCLAFEAYSKKLREYYKTTPREEESETLCDRNIDPKELNGKIVLIGGNRHQDPPSLNDLQDLPNLNLADDHDSPVGRLRGMYFHANYIEGLLDPDRILFTERSSTAAALDGLLAILILLLDTTLSESSLKPKIAHSIWGRVGLMWLNAVLLVLALSGIGRCRGYALDFVLPLVLLALHPALEATLERIFSPLKQAFDAFDSTER